MTDQEHDQHRQDLNQLDIEQLRCGVMLQLGTIEALTNERDTLSARYLGATRLTSSTLDALSKALTERDACATAERDSFAELCDAAQAVIDRWDSPAWKDQPHTAEFIARLRAALEDLK